MTDTMYRFDFRRLTSEEVEVPTPPPGISFGKRQPDEAANANITFAVMGTPPMPDLDER